MAPNFEPSRLKVKRAYRHVNEIKALLDRFIQSDFCQIRVETDPKTGRDNLQLVSIAHPPTEIPLAIGDTVHALRTAADYIVSGILPEFSKWISFPVGEERHDMEGTRSYRAIKESLPDLATHIRDVIQPYKGGDFKIWEISCLDNTDKHRLIVPVTSFYSIGGIMGVDDHGNALQGHMVSLEDIPWGQVGASGRAFTFCTGLKIIKYGKPAAGVIFPDGELFAGEPVLDTLAQMTHSMGEVIDALEALAFGNVSDPNSIPR